MFEGGHSQAPALPKLPDTRLKLFDDAFIVKDADGLPVSGLPYHIELPDGSIQHGITNELGQTHVITGADPEELKLYIAKGNN